MSCVYKHTFPNGAVYIGRTSMKPEDRWLNGWGYKNCPLMFAAILQFGWDNVKHEIIADNLTEEESTEVERAQIAYHSALHSESSTIYNISTVPAQYLAQENSHFIEPTLPQITTTDVQRYKGKNYIVPLTPKPHGVHIIPIDVYTKDGEFICTYPSAKVAAQELAINHGDIISCCKGAKSDGRLKYQVKGYIFRYHIKEKEVG